MLATVVKRCVKISRSLSVLLYLAGVIGLLALSQPEFNYETYVSENALLIGNRMLQPYKVSGLVDETYKPEPNISNVAEEFNDVIGDKIKTASIIRREMEKMGLEVYEQSFTFSHKLLEGIGVKYPTLFRPIDS